MFLLIILPIGLYCAFKETINVEEDKWEVELSPEELGYVWNEKEGGFRSKYYGLVDYDLLQKEWDADIEGHPDAKTLSKLSACFGIPGWSSFTCHGHGFCVGPDQCKCWPGFEGKNCSVMEDPHTVLITCFGKKANELGACGTLLEYEVEHGGVCKKDGCLCYCGYYGQECKRFDKIRFKKKKNCIQLF